MPPAEDAEPETHVELPYPEIRIYLDSLLWDRGFVRGETAYLPLSLFCRELNMEPLCVMTDGVLTVQAHSLELSAGAGDEYMTVNGRYIFTPGGFVMVGDEPYIPAEAAEAIFNVKITAAEDMSRLDLNMDGAGVITGGERYYTLNFDSADVFWLSRIIFAEATGQPLAGRIAVGNVAPTAWRTRSTPTPSMRSFLIPRAGCSSTPRSPTPYSTRRTSCRSSRRIWRSTA